MLRRCIWFLTRNTQKTHCSTLKFGSCWGAPHVLYLLSYAKTGGSGMQQMLQEIVTSSAAIKALTDLRAESSFRMQRINLSNWHITVEA